MTPGTLALTADLREVSREVATWCEKTSDSPRDGARALMRGTAAMAARAAARSEWHTARHHGLHYLALELYLSRLEGVR